MRSASARIDDTMQTNYKVWVLTVWGVLTCGSCTAIARDLDCVELWCGVGAVWKAAAAQGHRSQGFDMKNKLAENILIVLVLVVSVVIGVAVGVEVETMTKVRGSSGRQADGKRRVG